MHVIFKKIRKEHAPPPKAPSSVNMNGTLVANPCQFWYNRPAGGRYAGPVYGT